MADAVLIETQWHFIMVLIPELGPRACPHFTKLRPEMPIFTQHASQSFQVWKQVSWPRRTQDTFRKFCQQSRNANLPTWKRESENERALLIFDSLLDWLWSEENYSLWLLRGLQSGQLFVTTFFRKKNGSK